MNILELEPRGMDFYDNCPEKGHSDFDNFRYFGEIPDGHGGSYYLEVTIHFRHQYNRVNAFIEFSHNYFDGMCYKVNTDIVDPYKEAVLESVNRILKMNFDKIEIVERVNADNN